MDNPEIEAYLQTRGDERMLITERLSRKMNEEYVIKETRDRLEQIHKERKAELFRLEVEDWFFEPDQVYVVNPFVGKVMFLKVLKREQIRKLVRPPSYAPTLTYKGYRVQEWGEKYGQGYLTITGVPLEELIGSLPDHPDVSKWQSALDCSRRVKAERKAWLRERGITEVEDARQRQKFVENAMWSRC